MEFSESSISSVVSASVLTLFISYLFDELKNVHVSYKNKCHFSEIFYKFFQTLHFSLYIAFIGANYRRQTAEKEVRNLYTNMSFLQGFFANNSGLQIHTESNCYNRT